MAFCNSCGSELQSGALVCHKCGAAVVGSTPASASTASGSLPGSVPSTAPPAPYNQGSGVGKVILVIAAVLLGLAVLGMATAGFLGWRIAHHTRVRQEGDNVKVETPFGVVETTKDPDQAAKDLGVDIYPGAQIVKDGTASATFGNVHTSSANLTTSDSLDKVASFYKNKFPKAVVTTSDPNHCTIVSNDPKNLLTINIHSSGEGTQIQIARVGRGSESHSSE